MLDLVLTNRKGLVGNMKLMDSLACNDHETVEFLILRAAEKRVLSKTEILDFTRADFYSLRSLLSRVSCVTSQLICTNPG